MNSGSANARWYSDVSNLPSRDMNPEEALMAAEEPTPIAPARRRRAESATLQRALAELSDRQREVVQLRLAQKRGSEIAEIMGIAPEKVIAITHRAEKRLRWLATVGYLFSAPDLERDLSGAMEAKYVEILSRMWAVTSAKRVGSQLGVSSSTVEGRLRAALRRLAVASEKRRELRRYVDGLETLRQGGWGRGMRLADARGPSVRQRERRAG